MERQITRSLEKAKNYAFLLLKYRLRSEGEIRQRLKRKKFQDNAIDEVVAFLKDKKFIDDSIFAKAWVESRIKRPLGLRRIEQELRVKGVAQKTINAQLNKTRESYAEEEVARETAKVKLKRLKGVDPQTAKRRIYAYLLRRGFSPDIVYDVVNQL